MVQPCGEEGIGARRKESKRGAHRGGGENRAAQPNVNIFVEEDRQCGSERGQRRGRKLTLIQVQP